MSLLSGLNDDVDTEFGASPDFVKTAGDLTDDGKPPLTVVVAPAPDLVPGASDVLNVNPVPAFNEDEVMGLLNNHNVTLQTTEDDITRLHDMTDVEKRVLAIESIDQSEAAYVAQILPELTDEVAGVYEYTAIPTKTNLAATQNFVETKVADAKQALLDRYTAYVDADFSSIKELILRLDTDLLPALFDQLETLRQQALLDLAKASVSKNFMFYREDGKTLIDFRTAPINQYTRDRNDAETIRDSLPSQLLYAAMGEASREPFLTLFYELATTTRSKTFSSLMWTPRSEAPGLLLTYMDILETLSGGRLVSTLTTLLEELKVKGNETLTQTLEAKGDLDKIEAMLNPLRELCNLVHLVYSIHRVLRPWLRYADEIMQCYRKLF